MKTGVSLLILRLLTTPDEYKALKNEEQEGYWKKDDVYVKTTTSYPGNQLYIEKGWYFRTLKKEMLFAINFQRHRN